MNCSRSVMTELHAASSAAAGAETQPPPIRAGVCLETLARTCGGRPLPREHRGPRSRRARSSWARTEKGRSGGAERPASLPPGRFAESRLEKLDLHAQNLQGDFVPALLANTQINIPNRTDPWPYVCVNPFCGLCTEIRQRMIEQAAQVAARRLCGRWKKNDVGRHGAV